MAKKSTQSRHTGRETELPAAAQPHPLICPFSNKPMEIRMVGDGVRFMVISPHGFTSRLMRTRDECMEWAGLRAGKPTYKAPVVEVRHLEEPDTSAQEAVRDLLPDTGSVDNNELPPSLR